MNSCEELRFGDLTPSPGSRRWHTAAVLGIALVVRFAFIAQLSGSILFDQQQGDALLHFDMARKIADGDLFSDRVFYLAPLYPYFVAAIFAIAGPSVLTVTLVHLGLSVLDVWIIMTLARRLFGQAVGITAGAIAAVYGPFVFYTGFLLKETLGLVLFDAFLLCAACAVQPHAGRSSLLAGWLLGLASLVRPNLLPLALAVMGWLWFSLPSAHWTRRGAATLLFALGVVAAVLPVSLHNYVVGKEWVWISAHGGHNFFIGNRASATGLYEPLKAEGGQSPYDEEADARALAEQATGRRLKSSEVSAYWYGRGWREIRKNPVNFMRVTWRKLALFWNDYEIPDFQDFYFLRRECPVLWFAPLTLGLIAPFAGYGVIVSRHQWRDCLLLYTVILGVVLSVVPFFVFARYRLPVVPVVTVFAALGLVASLHQIAARDWRTLQLTSVVIVALAIVTNWPIYRPSDFLATSYFNIGGLYRAAGRVEEAATAWEEAVKLNPDYRKPHRALGELYFEAGRFHDAIGLLRRASAVTPSQVPADADVCYMLGVSLLRAGELAEAERLFRSGLYFWPDDARFPTALAELMQRPQRAAPE